MGNANRLVGYLASVASASLFYMVWLVISLELNGTPDSHTSVLFKIGFAFFFLLFSGVGAAFVLMAFPWYLSVRSYDRLQRFGLIYFSLIGAATTLVIGCGTSSLSPKPLFVDDQTFLEGFIITIERQGICLLVTGLVFGLLSGWLVNAYGTQMSAVDYIAVGRTAHELEHRHGWNAHKYAAKHKLT